MIETHIHTNSLIIESVRYLGYFGDIVFAVSGALIAARHRMDIIGFMLLGAITGIGGGTVRDLILDRPVFWLQNPFELMLCLTAAISIFVLVSFRPQTSEDKALIWADALGLSAFTIQGSHIAIVSGAHEFSALFLGVLSAVGGGLMRDIICGVKPFMLSGEFYASAALLGTMRYLFMLLYLPLPEYVSTLLGFSAVLLLRAIGIQFGIRLGSPGEKWLRRS